MRNVAPRLAVDASEYTIAEEQLEYSPVVASLVRFAADAYDTRVLRYTLTPEERRRIAAGEDIYFGTPGSMPLTPHWLCVGDPTVLPDSAP